MDTKNGNTPNLNLEPYINGIVDARVEQRLKEILSPIFPTLFGNLAQAAQEQGKRTTHQAPRRSTVKAPVDMTKFKEGQAVKYRQGRGEFTAKIKRVDAEHGKLLVVRDEDGTEVERDADKVYT